MKERNRFVLVSWTG